MTYDDCLKSGKLKKSVISGGVFSRTMKMAKEDLDSAKASFSQRNWAWSIVQSYSSMLNVSRAILFNDCFVEKSHYCVVEYLRHHHYDDLEDHVERLDLMRKERHQILYDSRDSVNKHTAELRFKWAEEYFTVVYSETGKKGIW